MFVNNINDYKECSEIEYILHDVQYKLSETFDKKILKLFRKYNVVLAGGALLSIIKKRMVNDYDLYVKSQEDANKLLKELEKTNSFKFLKKTNNSYNFIIYTSMGKIMTSKLSCQIIILPQFFYTSELKLISEFDFSICMAAYNFHTEKLFLDENVLNDINNEMVTYNYNNKYPVSTIFRYYKYIEKGYKFNKGEFIKIILNIMSLQPKTCGEMIKNITGVSTNYFEGFDQYVENIGETNKEFSKENFVEILDKYKEYVDVINLLTENSNNATLKKRR